MSEYPCQVQWHLQGYPIASYRLCLFHAGYVPRHRDFVAKVLPSRPCHPRFTLLTTLIDGGAVQLTL
eukprot:6202976-Pleurochrysis_carterae.AAC.2